MVTASNIGMIDSTYEIISIMILTNPTIIYKMVIVATSYYKLYHRRITQ